MAREHHCPNCGAQACNASTSKIHTCGVCAAIWEEDLSAPAPGPASPRPAAAAPASPAGTPAAPAKPAAPPATAPRSVPSPPAPAPTAVARPVATPAAPPPAPAPPAAKPASTPPSPTPPKTAGPVAPGGAKTLAEVLQSVKVKRCPACQSDGIAQPSDFEVVQGRVVLVDSQTYGGHRWYADTGETLSPVATPVPASAAPPPAARTNPAT